MIQIRLLTTMQLMATFVSSAACVVAAGADDEPVDFNRDVRPILSDTCFACHGPDSGQRQADLRLDLQEGLFRSQDGITIVDAKAAANSELLRRVESEDADMVMPPSDSGRTLTAEQKRTIRRWIEQGAEWKGHWAYIPPQRPAVPAVEVSDTANDIDRFIQNQLNRRDLQPLGQADPVTLVRRLSFDLTGLPPTPQQVAAFAANPSAEVWQTLVDELLATHHFGERMAATWLDQVRYADTNGIHGDNHREVWMYRDYVIDAFNSNMPFDRFTIEQLAGDLLPEPSDEQKVASGYNRLLMTTREGGAQPKEYLAKYSADRVRNASSVWLGATMACCECHDHKYDPYSIRDFYQFAAFFADIVDVPVGVQPATRMPSRTQRDRLAELQQQVEAHQTKYDEAVQNRADELSPAMETWLTDVQTRLADDNMKDKPAKDVAKALGLPEELLATLKAWPEVDDNQRGQVTGHFQSVTELLEDVRKPLEAARAERDAFEKTIPEMLVTRTQAPREIRVLARGNWMDDSGDVVAPSVPHFLTQVNSASRPTRMDLAEWFVADDNPLVARVFVNRLWQQFFGKGIVASADDFGSQGAWPTHPQLLDWLAVEFRESGWDVQHMIRLIVSSDAYRRASIFDEQLVAADPFNKWLARQSRHRLEAEFIRDTALHVSGLLVDEVGGPSVKPYQPAGYWAHLNFPTREWESDSGANQYRRGLYTYWCRTFLHPAMKSFDAPTREECTVERPRSNNSLQALVLLNDPTFVEAARALAERVLNEGGLSDEARIDRIYRQCLSRGARPEESAVLLELLNNQRAAFAESGDGVSGFLSVGQKSVDSAIDQQQLAAWTAVARAVLNLHETITRP